MFIIIMGCGRVGARLASQLSKAGHEVTVLDVNPRAFRRLGPDFAGSTIVGNGMDVDVLRQVGIERADAFAAVTQGDNRNVMVSQIAKHIFGIQKVATRIYDPLRQETFELLGIEAISPTVIGAEKFLEILDPELLARAQTTKDRASDPPTTASRSPE